VIKRKCEEKKQIENQLYRNMRSTAKNLKHMKKNCNATNGNPYGHFSITTTVRT